MPAVSVVIKAYNHASYVAQTISSVLAQTYGDFEIVVTDDASTDATPGIIGGFDDPRIRFERSVRNRGIARTMNDTVARARGEFIAILNSDDFALPERLETQVGYLLEHPEVGAVFDVPVQVGEFGEPVAGFGALFDVPFDHPNPSRQEWLRRLFFYGNCLCAPTAMIRRSAYLAAGDYDPRLAILHDLDRWVRLLERDEIHVMQRGLTAYRVRAGRRNASAPRPDMYRRGAFEFYQVLKRYRTFAPQLLREVFAADLDAHGINTTRATGVWFAEVALLGGHAAHPLLALESLYEEAREDDDVRRLHELAGAMNALRVDVPEP